MKRFILGILTLTLLASSCGTGKITSRQTDGIMTGATIGGTLGNAIGGLLGDGYGGWEGGYRGSAIGTILGTVAGAAIGHAATTPKNKSIKKMNPTPSIQTVPLSAALEKLYIHNVRYLDDNNDQIIQSQENCRIIFEIMNEGQETAYNVIPFIAETSGMKRIRISPSIMVEQIPPHTGIKYTATVHAGKKIHEGEAVFRLSVTDESGQEYDWLEFTIPTQR